MRKDTDERGSGDVVTPVATRSLREDKHPKQDEQSPILLFDLSVETHGKKRG